MAAKKTAAPIALDTLTKAQRAPLEPLLVRCAQAAMAQSAAGEAYRETIRGTVERMVNDGNAVTAARGATDAAGAALSRAIGALMVLS